MSSDSHYSPEGKYKEKTAVNHIWQLLDRNEVLSEVMRDWPGINSVTVQDNSILSYDPDGGSIPLGFAYFLIRDLRDTTISQCVDRAARYLSGPNVDKYPETSSIILHSFLEIYTG